MSQNRTQNITAQPDKTASMPMSRLANCHYKVGLIRFLQLSRTAPNASFVSSSSSNLSLRQYRQKVKLFLALAALISCSY
ncbi:unnamed protein product [Protopolystoma xenopodis]|uniref:Uncharacterized protein n=1 Tax=Protopolystoma xenopodis TaxID=117903 RepID=A0A3S5CGW7_9PLAT|nr:unnamed protein product [Protopolystoma xenopodis]